MNTIKICIKNKIPRLSASSCSEIISDNTGYKIIFEFDSEWDNLTTKTVYIVRGDGTYTTALLRDTNECSVPLVNNTRSLYIGVASGNIKTTCPCIIKVKSSIREAMGVEVPEPSTEVYDQIMEMLNEISSEKIPEEKIKKSVFEYLDENDMEIIPGYTYCPEVSKDGWLTWTNDGNLENPTPVNIKGPQGDKGDTGARGPQGEKGDTGATGSQGLQGPQGEKGDAGNTGPKGDKGDTGAAGKDGTTFTPSVSAAGVISWTNNGGLSNPTPVNIKGPQGDKGDTGAQGPKGDKGEAGTGATDEQIAASVENYFVKNPVEGGTNFETDETLRFVEGKLSVNTADSVEADNSLPITSAAVYTTVGNIDSILKTI